MYKRWQTKNEKIGSVLIGGGSPIRVQSMTNTDTRNVKSTVRQIKELEKAGCEIVRVAVPDLESARKIREIKSRINIPLVADIHFDYKLALESINQGADKIRINPGNIGSKERVKAVVNAAKKAKIPIRIGVNSGSLKEFHNFSNIKDRAGSLVKAALEHVKILESLNFYDIVVSIKASDVPTTIESYKLFATKRKYPLHLGITESGTLFRGTIKSSVGIGAILNEGLGDTIRVSLTSNPVEEVYVAYQILQALGLRSTGIDLISCPTCSRCKIDIIKVTGEIENALKNVKVSRRYKDKPLKIAVMGCVVNGPGEAKDADLGIAGGNDTGLFFKKGKPIGKVKPKDWVKTMVRMIKSVAR
ncbi:MAG: flavodoxin-dependent (E)-4-hydroxy-3-methylbut-2-enyl-diphosphate synthase [Endomicrobiales bacterium]|nr:flavodoxin-dependent (E)-4-hydroxy-3-methylbut-2-enyl-diphosphate synthase [Endomicrobiales bacterium]